MFPEFSPEEILQYSRHLMIPEIGLDGQRKLKTSSVLIIGAGGLGSPAAIYLTAAGVGRIGLVDFDIVERSNLQRQIIHSSSGIGLRKIISAKERLFDLNPNISLDFYDEPFTSTNAIKIASSYDVILDGSDNFPTRYLSNDLCVLTKKPNIYGAVFRFDGQASVFDARFGPCYRCLFPEPPPPGLVPSCADGGVLGILPGTIGTIQATETIKYLLGIGTLLQGKLLLYNALDMSFEYVTLEKNPLCKICGENPEITALIDYDAFCGVPGINHEIKPSRKNRDISPLELSELIKAGHHFTLVDVREPHELVISSIDGAKNIPLGVISKRLSELDPGNNIVVFCRTGSRSRRAQEILIGTGFTKVKNLLGGINAWVQEVDQSQTIY